MMRLENPLHICLEKMKEKIYETAMSNLFLYHQKH